MLFAGRCAWLQARPQCHQPLAVEVHLGCSDRRILESVINSDNSTEFYLYYMRVWITLYHDHPASALLRAPFASLICSKSY